MSLDKMALTEFLAQQFNLDSAGLDDELPLFSSSLLDSTSLIALVEFLEEQTGLTIEADDLTLDNFDTIASILAFCRARAG